MILDRAGVLPSVNYLTLHAERDDFHVSVPLEPLRGQGIVVYRLGPDPLGIEHGGPIRFLIRDPAACQTDQLDDCANVKYLRRIELTSRRYSPDRRQIPRSGSHGATKIRLNRPHDSRILV